MMSRMEKQDFHFLNVAIEIIANLIVIVSFSKDGFALPTWKMLFYLAYIYSIQT